jgi:hypothetical protein
MKITQRPSVSTALKGAAVAAASVVLAFSNAPASSAETGWIYVQGGKARWDSLNRLQYCDTAVDGNRVRVQLTAYIGGTVYFSGWAPSQSCNTEGHPTSIQYFRVCAENIGCSAWYHR